MDTPLPPALVLFGASGDLSQRKLLPALLRLFRAGKMPATFRLVGYGRKEMDDDSFRRLATEALAKHGAKDVSPEVVAAFADRLSYVRGGYRREDMARLAAAVPVGCAPIYYLALPPPAAESVLEGMAEKALPTENARILMEKPFGVDMESARRWNRLLERVFPENAIHRIDHYLAKDTVRNLLVFRFANILFEPVWNRHYVDHIQVSATETLGVENRGGYYDGIGVVRDMLQNHCLLMLAFAAMEAPLADSGESVRDRISDLLRSVTPPAPGDFIFGQYDGYRGAPGVDPASTTPTFAAVRLFVENWRWHGVPIYLMSGKSLDRRVSEVSVVFKQIPVCLLEDQSCTQNLPNILTFRIQPDEGIKMTLGVKAPGLRDDILPASMDFRYADVMNAPGGTHELFTGYERVLLEALEGRPGLSWRADSVEAAWRIVQPMLADGPGRREPVWYAPGSAAAALAADLLHQDKRRWCESGI